MDAALTPDMERWLGETLGPGYPCECRRQLEHWMRHCGHGEGPERWMDFSWMLYMGTSEGRESVCAAWLLDALGGSETR